MANQIQNNYRVYFGGVEGITETTVTAETHREAEATVASRYGMAHDIVAHMQPVLTQYQRDQREASPWLYPNAN